MKDIVIYGIVPDGKSTWRIVNEDRIFIVDIHDYDIEGICEGICIRDDIEKYSAEKFIGRVWEELRDFFSPEINSCELASENWDKFRAWCDDQIMDYFTTELSNMYKQRLLDFE